jgi:hypothetical protein
VVQDTDPIATDSKTTANHKWRARVARLLLLARAARGPLGWLWRVVRPRGGAFVLFCALLLADVAYRLVLIYHLSTDPVTPFSFVPLIHNQTAIVRCFALDWLFIATLCATLGVVELGIKWLAPVRFLPTLRVAGWTFAAAIALAAGLDAGAQLRALLSMHTGIDAMLLLEATSSATGRDLLRYAEPVDLVLAGMPMFLLVLLARAPARLERLRLRFGIGLSVACLLAYVPYAAKDELGLSAPQLNMALRWAPLYYTSYFLWHHLTDGPGEFQRMAWKLPAIEHHGLFVNEAPPSTSAVTPPHERYNVLLVIMESTGAHYVQNIKKHQPVPMPRLRTLMTKGLALMRHYAASNTSPRAIFSIYTGLYPQTTPAMFVTRPDLLIPGIASALGPGYDSFFVTPGRLQFYMPHALLEHDGVREIYGYENLPIANPVPMPGKVGLDEIPTVDFFLKRLGAAKEPFFATYYSFVAHYDYYDHGPDFRIFTDTGPAINRYYNNLRLLDTQIGRILDQLSAEGRLDRTLVVLVGDHGEGFGQHPGDVTHSRHSFDENLRTPALFYQPRLFPPRRIDVPTSHVDILPTMLDALGIPYDATHFQGVSLARGVPERKYIYTWGNEGVLSLVDRPGRKVQISFDRDRCWYYDLIHDSKETDRHKCDAGTEPEFQNLLRFWNFQRKALADYNQALHTKR